MKIKLSKKNWEEMGKKAGWFGGAPEGTDFWKKNTNQQTIEQWKQFADLEITTFVNQIQNEFGNGKTLPNPEWTENFIKFLNKNRN